jgi:hypothetical protein
MMTRGRILKVKEGHEANCSSGMIALMILIGAGVTLLPASLITAGLQATRLRRGESPLKQTQYWAIPVGFGIIATLVGIWFVSSSGYSDSYLLPLVLSLGGSYILAVMTGYALAPRLKRTGWLFLLVPLILVAGGAISLYLSSIAVLVAIVVGLMFVAATGRTRPLIR